MHIIALNINGSSRPEPPLASLTMGQNQSQPAQARTSTLRRMSDVVQNRFKRSRLGSLAAQEFEDTLRLEQPAPQPEAGSIRTRASELSEYYSLTSRRSSLDVSALEDQDQDVWDTEPGSDFDSAQSIHSRNYAFSGTSRDEPRVEIPLLGRLLAIAASLTAASLIGEGNSPSGFIEFIEELYTSDLTPQNMLRTFSFPESNGQIPLVIVWVRERSPGESWVILVIGSNFPSEHPITQSTGNLRGLEELLVAEGLLEQKLSQESIDALGGVRLAGQAEDRCAICLEDCPEGDELRALKCSHEYHKDCVDKWVLKGHNSCPTCRQKVVETQPSGMGWEASAANAFDFDAWAGP